MTERDLRLIAAESLCDLRTVRAAYDGKPITSVTRERIRRAAELLNVDTPPAPLLRGVLP